MALKINRTAQRVFKGIGIVLLVILVACMLKILIWESSYYRNKSSETRAAADAPITRIVSALNPDETKPTDKEIANYQVEADKPRYLDIKRLNVHARVQISSVNTNGLLSVPNNIYDTSWYSGSSRPGHGGYIIVSGVGIANNSKGVFANLDSLEQDDEIVLEVGLGDKYTYQVKEINIVSDEKDTESTLAKLQKRLDQKETLSLVTLKTSGADQKFESLVMLRATLKE